MIQQEIVTIGGREYKRTYSDLSLMIERDGKRYEEAMDIIEHGYAYTETEEPIPSPDAETEDYDNALKELGVEI